MSITELQPTDKGESVEPTSADYLRRIQQEQDDAITSIAELDHAIAVATANGAPPEQIKALASAKAQLSRVMATRIKDVAVSYQASNLSAFMGRMDAYTEESRARDQAILAAQQEGAEAIKKAVAQIAILAGRVDGVEEGLSEAYTRLDTHDKQHADHDARLTAVEGRAGALEGRVDVLEAIALETGATDSASQFLRQLRKKRGG